MRRSMMVLAAGLISAAGSAAEPALPHYDGDGSGAGSFQGAPSTANARLAPPDDGLLVVGWNAGRGESKGRIEPDGDRRIDEFVLGADEPRRRFAPAELKRR